MGDRGCCGPGQSSEATQAVSVRDAGVPRGAGEDGRGMALIPGGAFRMGCDRREGHPGDGEGPARMVHVGGFEMDRLAVTNARFARFVAATGYVTAAERAGWSFVFAGLLPDDFPPTEGAAAAPWWRKVEGADWRHPDGPRSTIEAGWPLPVVHVAHDDAMAFCDFAGKRLPTEAEWEKAARGGLEGARFPWGDEETPGGRHHCNVWQGTFPSDNGLGDGYYGLAPAAAFPPNGYGLRNMAGNCWEWCADWFDPHLHRSAGRTDTRGGPARSDPRAPADSNLRAMRGGSYLCHPSYCWRYRVAARSAATPDSSTGHIGFRCVRDPVA